MFVATGLMKIQRKKEPHVKVGRNSVGFCACVQQTEDPVFQGNLLLTPGCPISA